MVAVFNKDLLSWYLITLKLRETVDQNLPKSGPSSPSHTIPAPLSQNATHPLTIADSHDNPNPDSNSNQDAKQTSVEIEPVTNIIHGPISQTTSTEPHDSWITSIQQRLHDAGEIETKNPWAKLSIYRIPETLREGDEKSFVPQMVSIGPFHHGKEKLREMEQHKWRAMHRMLHRTGHKIDRYINAIRPLEERVRSCYEGHIPMQSHELILCLVLDGTFVLELFRGATSRNGFTELGYSHHDPVFATRCAMHSIQRDMIMLENQIPLFVLDRLFAIQLDQKEHAGLVARLAICFFDPLMPTDEPLKRRDRERMESSIHKSINAMFDPLSEAGSHCLDVFRRSLLRNGPKPMPPRVWLRRWSRNRPVADKRRQQFIHCVSELQDAGITCRRKITDKFWDISFESRGVLQIPRILIHDGTKSLFLNMIAFEQCHPDMANNMITSYVIFMDNLINTEEDVRYLHDQGIIEHWLGDDSEVAELFSRLCQEVVFDFNDSYLSHLSDHVNRYYSSRWNTWTASLINTYFNNPWAFISFIAGVVLLLLTFGQTIYTVLPYYVPPKN
ncbi:hypothetical protein LUZ62_035919 [Rhynchospora pubera]|uniref:Uncharacterized protein n=1 Tax=Rhynchospora pubera TaxID=906938 RepID=A0AAV8F1T6_9POAL|nr:hypothetical protein LUZ62_035919 [Rhynchospora pubera]